MSDQNETLGPANKLVSRGTPDDSPGSLSSACRIDSVIIAGALRPISEEHPRIAPYLCVDDGQAALRFYTKVLGGIKRMRIEAERGEIGHAEVMFDGSVMMVADELPDHVRSPWSIGATPVTIVLYVDDFDAAFERAVNAGAMPLEPLADRFYGDRSDQIEDPFGHRWSLMTHVEDVAPDESPAAPRRSERRRIRPQTGRQRDPTAISVPLPSRRRGRCRGQTRRRSRRLPN